MAETHGTLETKIEEITKYAIAWTLGRIWEERELKHFLEKYIAKDLKETIGSDFNISVRLSDGICDVLSEYVVPHQYDEIADYLEIGPIVSAVKYCNHYINVHLFDHKEKMHYDVSVKLKALINAFGRHPPASFIIPQKIIDIEILSYPHPQ
jgi:hypothetical protein